MFIIMKRDLLSGQSEIVCNIAIDTFQEAERELTDIIRRNLSDNPAGSIQYSKHPQPGYYNRKGQPVLFDDENIKQFNDGVFLYYIYEIEDETEPLEE